MIVMKFGGSSLADAGKILAAAKIVKKRLRREPIVVVSANGDTTDRLEKLGKAAAERGLWEKQLEEIIRNHEIIAEKLGLEVGARHTSTLQNSRSGFRPYNCAKEISYLRRITKHIAKLGELSEANRARLLSFGERCSAKLFAVTLQSLGVQSSAYNSYDLGMLTDRNYREAKISPDAPKLLRRSMRKLSGVPVITGFLGKAKGGDITTLGRGGSDVTAAVIGAALGAREIEIWTDVSGVMTADPRVVPEAWPVRKLSFAEAAELAYFGARVLHPKTIAPAITKSIPVRVLNTFAPNDSGTLIVPKSRETGIVAKAIAYKKGVTAVVINSLRMLDAHGFLARVFEIFKKYKISVDMITTSEVSIALTVDDDRNLEQAVEELKKFARVFMMNRRAIVCVVGEGMKKMRGMAGRIFSCLGREDINIEMISHGASEINVSFLVREQDVASAVRTLHRNFFGQ